MRVLSPLCFKTPPNGEPEFDDGQAATIESAEEKEVSNEAPSLICRQCGFPITIASERIAVDGAHYHTFANPHGIVFEIGCFQNARGCSTTGAPTDEFSWFSGYFWQIALCGSCLIHMGWRFCAPDRPDFFGLILDRLVDTDRT
ncbi:MAG: cereblon family protein [Thermodesulfobacteriota bacterium]